MGFYPHYTPQFLLFRFVRRPGRSHLCVSGVWILLPHIFYSRRFQIPNGPISLFEIIFPGYLESKKQNYIPRRTS